MLMDEVLLGVLVCSMLMPFADQPFPVAGLLTWYFPSTKHEITDGPAHGGPPEREVREDGPAHGRPPEHEVRDDGPAHGRPPEHAFFGFSSYMLVICKFLTVATVSCHWFACVWVIDKYWSSVGTAMLSR